eukprot:1399107-Pyramimonas_sp.AAC.1
MARQRPPKAPNSSAKQATNFNDVVYTDVFWIKNSTGKTAVLSVIDGATRYCALRTVKTETAEELIKAVERGWIMQLGPVGELRTDDGSGFASDRFTQFLEQHSISIVIAAGEAHSSLGVVERRHQVVREVVGLHCADVIDRGAREAIAGDLITEACIHVPHQVNRLAFAKGYSPCQWVWAWIRLLP